MQQGQGNQKPRMHHTGHSLTREETNHITVFPLQSAQPDPDRTPSL